MNWHRVQELKTEVGADAFAEVIDLFIEETDVTADRLAARPDPATLGDDLHFMKGAALNLGFDELAAACAGAEAALRSAGPGAVDLPGLLDSYSSAKAELLAAERPARAG